MRRTPTLTIDDEVYAGLERQVGHDHVEELTESLVRLHVCSEADLDEGYRELASDHASEQAAREWSEGLIGDVAE